MMTIDEEQDCWCLVVLLSCLKQPIALFAAPIRSILCSFMLPELSQYATSLLNCWCMIDYLMNISSSRMHMTLINKSSIMDPDRKWQLRLLLFKNIFIKKYTSSDCNLILYSVPIDRSKHVFLDLFPAYLTFFGLLYVFTYCMCRFREDLRCLPLAPCFTTTFSLYYLYLRGFFL